MQLSACLVPLAGLETETSVCACVPPLTAPVCHITQSDLPSNLLSCAHTWLVCICVGVLCTCRSSVGPVCTQPTLAECLKSCCCSITRHMPHAHRRLQELDHMSLSVSVVTLMHTLRIGADRLRDVPRTSTVFWRCCALLSAVEPTTLCQLVPSSSLSLHTDTLALG